MTTSRAYRLFGVASSIMFWACAAEVVLLPACARFLPASQVIGPERWFAQGRYIDDLIDNGYDRAAVVTFSTTLNAFVATCLAYVVVRLIFVALAPRPAARAGLALVSILVIAIVVGDMRLGIGHGHGLYDISTSKPLALDLGIILVLVLMFFVFAGELLAQAVALARLQYAERWSA